MIPKAKKVPQVEILLATYNGEKYLGELLDSVLSQQFDDYSLIVRDDGSTDSTLALLESYQQKFPGKIRVHYGIGDPQGPVGNFSELLELSSAPYVMFCDQDDVWLPNKIDVSFEKIRQMEADFGSDTPLLAHSDLLVVDHGLRPIADSFWAYSGIDPHRDKLGNLLVQNVVTGCASIVNRSLVRSCGKIPPKAQMHDWWVGLVAAAMGKIGRIEVPAILYRQHAKNRLGAKEFRWRLPEILERLGKWIGGGKRAQYYADSLEQARLFLEHNQNQLEPKKLEILSEFIDLPHRGFIEKRKLILKHGFLYAKFIQNAALLIRI